jgi:hypothetical protein
VRFELLPCKSAGAVSLGVLWTDWTLGKLFSLATWCCSVSRAQSHQDPYSVKALPLAGMYVWPINHTFQAPSWWTTSSVCDLHTVIPAVWNLACFIIKYLILEFGKKFKLWNLN